MPIKIQVLGADALQKIGALSSRRKEDFMQSLEGAMGKFGLDAVYLAKTKYLRGPKPSKIESKGQLRASITSKVTRDGNQIKMQIGSPLIYARIQEMGGTTRPNVTDRMRKFAWFMYFNTRDDKWKRMALTRKSRLVIKIPARPYLRPAIKDAMPSFQDNLKACIRNISFAGGFGGK